MTYDTDITKEELRLWFDESRKQRQEEHERELAAAEARGDKDCPIEFTIYRPYTYKKTKMLETLKTFKISNSSSFSMVEFMNYMKTMKKGKYYIEYTFISAINTIMIQRIEFNNLPKSGCSLRI